MIRNEISFISLGLPLLDKSLAVRMLNITYFPKLLIELPCQGPYAGFFSGGTVLFHMLKIKVKMVMLVCCINIATLERIRIFCLQMNYLAKKVIETM